MEGWHDMAGHDMASSLLFCQFTRSAVDAEILVFWMCQSVEQGSEILTNFFFFTGIFG
jgi:hypothetical protein